MSKDNKNEMTADPEDQREDFPRGTSASGDLDPRPVEQVGADKPHDPSQPTKAGAGAERQGRRSQEGAAEQTTTGREGKS